MIAIFSWFGYRLPMRTCFDLIKQVGFDGVTLWWSDDFGDNDFRNNPVYARNAGLYVENIHTPYIEANNLWLDTLQGEALQDYFVGVVDECSVYDIPTMVLHLSSSGNPPPFNDIGLSRIKRVVERAEDRGVKVAFENLRILGHLEFVLSRVSSPYAGFCYDSGHHHCRTPHEDPLSDYGSRLMALHLHDNDGADDQHRLPFDGTIEWSEVMKKIAQTGYSGPVTLEVENVSYEHMLPVEFLHRALERAKRLEMMMSNA